MQLNNFTLLLKALEDGQTRIKLIQLIVKEKERSGRKRKLDAVTVARIVKEAQDTVFTTPKRIKRGTHL